MKRKKRPVAGAGKKVDTIDKVDKTAKGVGGVGYIKSQGTRKFRRNRSSGPA